MIHRCRFALAATSGLVIASVAACQEWSRPGPSGDVLPEARTSLELSIGLAEGPDHYLFHQVLDLVGFEDGGFWVLDGGVFGANPRLRRYSPQGEFLGPVGRQGSGPGEFLAPYAMTMTADGRVVVRDRMDTRRLLVFARDGTWEEDWTLPRPFNARAGEAETLVRDAADVFWLQILTSRPGDRRPAEGRRVYVRIRPGGEVIDTVASPSLPASAPRETVRVEMDGDTVPVTVPFQTRPILALTPHGRFAVGTTGEYALALTEPAPWHPATDPNHPRTTDWISRDPPAVPVSNAERRAWVDWVGERVGRQEISALPESKPPLLGVQFDADGRAWVRVATPAVPVVSSEIPEESPPVRVWSGELHEPQTYEVFDMSGEILARVVLPSGSCRGMARTFRSRASHLWCVHVDERGVESVRRYHVVWP